MITLGNLNKPNIIFYSYFHGDFITIVLGSKPQIIKKICLQASNGILGPQSVRQDVYILGPLRRNWKVRVLISRQCKCTIPTFSWCDEGNITEPTVGHWTHWNFPSHSAFYCTFARRVCKHKHSDLAFSGVLKLNRAEY